MTVRRKMFCLAVGLVLLVGLARTRFTIAITDGESMSPTLKTGDVLLVDKWAFRDLLPERGDVVVAKARGEILVKRVMGLPGEFLQMDGGELRINGVQLQEEYTTREKRLDISGGVLNADRFALVGDNRSLTTDELVHAIAGSGDIGGRVVWALRLSSFSLLQVY